MSNDKPHREFWINGIDKLATSLSELREETTKYNQCSVDQLVFWKPTCLVPKSALSSLQAELEKLKDPEYHKLVLEAVKALRYIKGIVERGENRKVAGNEPIEKAILEYVKKLEKQLEAVKTELKELKTLNEEMIAELDQKNYALTLMKQETNQWRDAIKNHDFKETISKQFMIDTQNRHHEELAAEKAKSAKLVEALKKAEKRFSHIEDWHRDNVTPDNFEDCQEVGQTPESYLRDGKNESRKALAEYEAGK